MITCKEQSHYSYVVYITNRQWVKMIPVVLHQDIPKLTLMFYNVIFKPIIDTMLPHLKSNYSIIDVTKLDSIYNKIEYREFLNQHFPIRRNSI